MHGVCRFRWSGCSQRCFRPITHEKLCSHQQPVRTFYYLSVRDRLNTLLRSDLRNLFRYSEFRNKSSNGDVVQDIYDSETYKKFETFIPEGNRLIFLQVRTIKYSQSLTSLTFIFICTCTTGVLGRCGHVQFLGKFNVATVLLYNELASFIARQAPLG